MAQEKQRNQEMTARQMSHEIQQLMKSLGAEEFQDVFQRSLMGWIKGIPEGKRKQKLLEDLYPTLPVAVRELVTRETGFSSGIAAAQE
jgi:hypothetical protein